ncbi:MAG: recombination-associated protein RdgC [Desulfobacterales bacterium]
METLVAGLKKNVIREIDEDPTDKEVGWTSFEKPYQPDFEGASLSIGTHWVFSLRIDKKKIPLKVVQKMCAQETAKKLTESGREFLSRNEKKILRENVINTLSLRIPATPSIYDLIWSYEDACVFFFSNLKEANEELETLFAKSFKLTLIRLFPFTIADLNAGLANADRDILSNLTPTRFNE